MKTNLDHVKKLEQDLERQQAKTKALRSTKKELYDKVPNDGKITQAAHEQRLQVPSSVHLTFDDEHLVAMRVWL